MHARLGSPRLWGELWRVLAAVVVGGGLLAAVLWASAESPTDGGRGTWLAVGDPLLGLAAVGLMLLRRRYPLPVAVLTACAGALSVSSVGAAGICLISLATHRRWWLTLVGALASVVGGMAYELVFPSDEFTQLGNPDQVTQVGNLITQVMVVLAAVALGSFIGARRENIAVLRERLETAEREQHLKVDQARATERARIAREMHDVLAHRISLIAMHAGALAYREDLPREQVRATATLLRDNADQAVTELRAVLGVLRDADELGQPRAPQADLRRLEALSEEAHQAGTEVRVDHRVDIDLADIPDAVSRHAYRIVQESLTNARKHAPGMPVEVHLEGGPALGLDVTVVNRPSAYGASAPETGGSGLGLLGLRERAALTGGRLSYGPDRSGRFVVHAWLPWQRGDDTDSADDRR